MKSFLLGVVAGIAALLLGVGALMLSLGSPGAAPGPVPSPSAPLPGEPGSVPEGQTWLGDVDLSSSRVLTHDGPLEDLHARGAAVSLTPDGLVARRLTIDAVLPFATAAAQIGEGVELYAAGDGLAGIRRTVSILGRDVVVTATGSVRAEDGQLVIEPETIDLGGPDWLDSGVSAAVRQLVTIHHSVEGLPEGMLLTRVAVEPGGFRAHLEGTDVQLAS